MNCTSHRLFVALLLLASALFGGCAHNNARDPLEPLNRGIYAFNDAVDSVVLKPVATGYREVIPQIVRTGVTNFFSNLDDIVVVLNGLLQFKLPQALSDTARFLVNSTVGLLGVIDVATHLGLEKHNEDFGQTLGYWGVADGPYLVLPFLGPSSVRDGVGRMVDGRVDTVRWQDHVRTRNQFMGLRIVNTRAGLLGSEKVLETAAIDEYSFVRDAYLQRRRSLVYDGNPPPEKEDEDLPGPRSGAETFVPATRVEDQWGGLVASSTPLTGGHTVELLRATSTAPRRPAPAAAPAPAAEPAPTAEPAAMAAPATPSAQSAGPAAAEQPARVVRVWVSSGAH
jgi:phospholipid-binding lipoprotein MlaA